AAPPGRTPEQPRQLLRAGPGPDTVERESGKSRWRAGQARSFFWRLLWRATPPHFWGNGKRDGQTPSPTNLGARSYGCLSIWIHSSARSLRRRGRALRGPRPAQRGEGSRAKGGG